MTSFPLLSVPDGVRTVELSLHMENRDRYITCLATLPGHVEHSEFMTKGPALPPGNYWSDDYWHVWATATRAGVDYVVHDPTRYEENPLNADRRVRELEEMMAEVLRSETMTGLEKVEELRRLGDRVKAVVLGVDAAPARLESVS